MEFRKAMFGYPIEQVRSLIAGLEEEQGREEQQLAERISAAEAEIKEMEERLAEQYFASVKSVHTSRYEAREKQAALEKEKERRRQEMERVESLMLKLCSQLDELSAGFDLAMEGEGNE